MRRALPILVVSAAVGLGILGGGLAAWAANAADGDGIAKRLTAIGDIPHPMVVALGLDPARAKPAIAIPAGDRWGVVANDDARCLVGLTDGTGDTCSIASDIAVGRGVNAQVDCRPGLDERSLLLRGFVDRDGIATVEVLTSGGRVLTADVAERAYVIDTTIPDDASDVPTAIRWLAGDRVAAEHPFPFDGKALCDLPIR